MSSATQPAPVSSSRWAWILGISVLLAAAVIAGAISNFNRAGDEIQVTGSAKRDIAADFVVWKLNVEARLPALAEATREARTGAEQVRTWLLSRGFADSAINVRAPTTYAENEFINGTSTGRILAYHVSQEVEVRSAEVEQIAQLAGNTEGLVGATRASVIAQPPEYLINQLPEIRGGLTAEATRDARARAEEILAAVGTKPGRIKAVRVGVIQVSRRNSTDVSDYGMYDTRDRNKEVTAVVRVTFAVK